PFSVEIPRDDFPVRSQPNDSSEPVTELSAGKLLYPESITGSWYKVPFKNGVYGYVHQSYVTPKEAKGNVAVFPGTYLFTSASENSEGLTVVSKNTEVTITGKDGEWCRVTVYGSNAVGYIKEAQLSIPTKKIYSTTILGDKIIVVDPGHGSYKTATATTLDSGAVGPSGIKEKDVNLKIAMALKSYLEADGATVIMTRTGDVGVLTLTDRAMIANNNNADLFISIHCNSSENSSAHGTETYYSKVDEYAADIDSSLLSQRKAVASSVQNNLISQIQRNNRGVKTNNFTVITKTKMPSVLIETAFISNPTEEMMLNSSSFQNSAAKGCYLGILDYFTEIENS
ncbi:MAG: N-acetylmuramoyl-L-alanine amidase, partial [Bacillota bacterium]|nr:N-acetylmuramoyl-L-alanine amidase [Bacillota bacterium]